MTDEDESKTDNTPILHANQNQPGIKLGEDTTAYGDIGKLYAALAAAQGAYQDVEKNGYNAHKDYRYAKLEDLLQAVKPALADNNLSILQSLGGDKVHTILGHESGAMIVSSLSLPSVNLHGDSSGGVHAMGSAITYARRYSLQSLLGVSAETDDDGQRAQQATTRDQADKVRHVFEPDEPLSVAQKENLEQQGWRKDEDEPHWWGYFAPGSVDEAMLEKKGTLTVER